jgi:hypothetical protein
MDPVEIGLAGRATRWDATTPNFDGPVAIGRCREGRRRPYRTTSSNAARTSPVMRA